MHERTRGQTPFWTKRLAAGRSAGSRRVADARVLVCLAGYAGPWRDPFERGCGRGTSPAWAEQSWALALLGAAAALANWATTGDHLGKTIPAGEWPVASVDLVLLAGSAAAAWAGYRLSVHGTLRRSAVPVEQQGEPAHV